METKKSNVQNQSFPGNSIGTNSQRNGMQNQSNDVLTAEKGEDENPDVEEKSFDDQQEDLEGSDDSIDNTNDPGESEEGEDTEEMEEDTDDQAGDDERQ